MTKMFLGARRLVSPLADLANSDFSRVESDILLSRFTGLE